MKIRRAILLAARRISANPILFDFCITTVPKTACGSPGCALGWITHYLNFKAKSFDPALKLLKIDEWDFYQRMREVFGSGEWKKSATDCADALRQYANKFHPLRRSAPKTGDVKSEYL